MSVCVCVCIYDFRSPQSPFSVYYTYIMKGDGDKLNGSLNGFPEEDFKSSIGGGDGRGK